ncbi:hypothetical protein NL676_039654 [Syzygium grande]|nr:hypothetical protein NL676_039654 [Syzygium grande]
MTREEQEDVRIMGCEDGRGPWGHGPKRRPHSPSRRSASPGLFSLSLAACLVDALRLFNWHRGEAPNSGANAGNFALAAAAELHGKEVVVECKFDGDRIQVHKNGFEIHICSRNFLDHTEYGPGMSDIIINNIVVNRCILDGDMLVWDKSVNRFAEFGSNQEIAKAARDGLDSDRPV